MYYTANLRIKLLKQLIPTNSVCLSRAYTFTHLLLNKRDHLHSFKNLQQS